MSRAPGSMNRASIVCGAVAAAVSLLVTGYIFDRWLPTHWPFDDDDDDDDQDQDNGQDGDEHPRRLNPQSPPGPPKPPRGHLGAIDDGSCLERDLDDLLELLPLDEMRCILDNHMRYDKQIDDTVAFFRDQGRFLCEEAWRIPQVQFFAFVLRELGLNVERRRGELRALWKDLPSFVCHEPEIEAGGLTGMISRLLGVVPRDELHALLLRKFKESKSFRTLLYSLRSRQFYELRDSVKMNAVIQRNFHWAKESGLEAIFAMELLGDLYVYLTQEIY